MYLAAESSGEQTTTKAAYTGPCCLASVLVITDGTNTAKVVIDDSTDGSGTVKYETSVVGANHYGGRNWTFPVKFTTGVYVTVTGTGASYIIETASP